MTQPDRPLLGIALMCGFCVLAPLGDAVAKLLGGVVPLGMLILVRFAVQVIIMGPLTLVAGNSMRLNRRLWVLTLARTALHIAGIGLMFTAVRYLPLADAVAIAFVFPFIMLLLGWFYLDEHVGPHRLSACAVGFIGTLCVIQPNFISVGAIALLPVGVAVVFAVFMLLTRAVAKEIDPKALQTISGLQACAVLVPLMLWAPAPVLALVMPDLPTSGLLVALGLVGTMGHFLMSWSLRYAPSATLAPMQYLEIPIGTLIGWLIWRELPNGLAAVGICTTICAGLYIILRERAMSRAMPAVP
jgi:drug/metabolite transporter (DMT)-like permease